VLLPQEGASGSPTPVPKLPRLTSLPAGTPQGAYCSLLNADVSNRDKVIITYLKDKSHIFPEIMVQISLNSFTLSPLTTHPSSPFQSSRTRLPKLNFPASKWSRILNNFQSWPLVTPSLPWIFLPHLEIPMPAPQALVRTVESVRTTPTVSVAPVLSVWPKVVVKCHQVII